MEEQLSNLCSRLNLTAEEDVTLDLDADKLASDAHVVDKCLLGRILTTRSFNVAAFNKTMEIAWRLPRKFTMKEVGDNLFVFTFANEVDKRRVLDLGPWSFDKSLVLLEHFDGISQPSALAVTHASFWIQCHNLPLLSMNVDVARLVGNSLGVYEDLDLGEGGLCWGKFLRIRVRVDCTKPLRRGMKFRIMGGETIWIDIRYEKLMDFCYWCGHLSHGYRECDGWHEAGMPKNIEDFQYGHWLRANGPGKKAGLKTKVPPNSPKKSQRPAASPPSDDGSNSPTGMEGKGGKSGEPLESPASHRGDKGRDVGSDLGGRDGEKHFLKNQITPEIMETDIPQAMLVGSTYPINNSSHNQGLYSQFPPIQTISFCEHNHETISFCEHNHHISTRKDKDDLNFKINSCGNQTEVAARDLGRTLVEISSSSHDVRPRKPRIRRKVTGLEIGENITDIILGNKRKNQPALVTDSDDGLPKKARRDSDGATYQQSADTNNRDDVVSPGTVVAAQQPHRAL